MPPYGEPVMMKDLLRGVNNATLHATLHGNTIQGRGVPVRYVELIQEYSPGYIILSYVIAVVGSLCTLELLLRR